MCFPPTPNVATAMQYNYPSVKTFAGATCTDAFTMTTVSDVCTPVSAYPVTGTNNLVCHMRAMTVAFCI